jgi:UDP-N-acetylglucosamine diphosphorylase / glucose-1-phosphate thymidylyltransferase / UDP-N-acetylgalactosamine diphosphorylase / glucosamine-1-phosphate N-acetyltransferase / galactosamine-1-phosphate N-acetyltransferase
MQFVLVDLPDLVHFYPFSLTRSLTEIRVGIFTIKERWETHLNSECQVFTSPYLQSLYASPFLDNEDAVMYINSTCLPDVAIKNAILNLKEGESLLDKDGKWIASNSKERAIGKILLGDPNLKTTIPAKFIKNPIHLLQIHAAMIQLDFNQVISNQTSIVVDASNRLICPENIFIAEGASLSGVSLNATEGPIYIGKNAMLMEGAAIRGPFVLGEKSVVKMNACIYGATSVGPFCTIGGEIKNSILMGYSNKAHEGYLGDSIIGQWCNLGAGTSNSNVKNTAGPIEIWNQYQKSWDTIGNKMGMLVGDYTRFAIQSSINTGSYIGASANIYGNGLLPKMIPNFSWGITKGYILEKAIEDIQNWKKMKGFQISDAEKEVLTALFHME